MIPIAAGAQFGHGEYVLVEVKLRLHQLCIAAFQHRPVHEALILSGKGAAAPFPVIRRKGLFCIYIVGIESEKSAVEPGGSRSVGITRQHISEEGVIAGHRGCLAGGNNKTALPEFPPPCHCVTPVVLADSSCRLLQGLFPYCNVGGLLVVKHQRKTCGTHSPPAAKIPALPGQSAAAVQWRFPGKVQLLTHQHPATH